jgi:SP family sugar:H+ symporter-like MFS transporter
MAPKTKGCSCSGSDNIPVYLYKGTLTPQNTPIILTPADVSEVNLASTTRKSDDEPAPDAVEKRSVTISAVLLAAVASIGGFIFGYESGQISGKVEWRAHKVSV